nr:endonuclease/exonuclease/phosphatase family protein [Pseudomonas syringae]
MIAEYLRRYDLDSIVLSELSGAQGSVSLIAFISALGYKTIWSPPVGRGYSVAIAIKNYEFTVIENIASSGLEPERYQSLVVHLGKFDLSLFGLYFPSLNVKNLPRRSRDIPFIVNSLERMLQYPDANVLFGGDINEIPPWHLPRIIDYAAEGYPLHAAIKRLGLVDLAKIHLPPCSYTWFDRNGGGQLLDGAFVSSSLKYSVDEYYICHEFREAELSDHSGLIVSLLVD